MPTRLPPHPRAPAFGKDIGGTKEAEQEEKSEAKEEEEKQEEKTENEYEKDKKKVEWKE